jgi:hypothetical protein
MLRVLGERNRFRLQFNQPGCARWATVQFGEIALDGKFNDLSSFSTTVADWRVARLEVKERRGRALLDGKLVHQTAYQQPVGPIRGIVYNFRGGGSVDYVWLYNAGKGLVYADEFNQQPPTFDISCSTFDIQLGHNLFCQFLPLLPSPRNVMLAPGCGRRRPCRRRHGRGGGSGNKRL